VFHACSIDLWLIQTVSELSGANWKEVNPSAAMRNEEHGELLFLFSYLPTALF
jgi:hypothetical protein